MGTITHLFDPGQIVYVIEQCNDSKLSVSSGTVIRVKGFVLVTGLDLRYDIRVGNNSYTTEFVEDNIFPDKATAIAEYETRV